MSYPRRDVLLELGRLQMIMWRSVPQEILEPGIETGIGQIIRVRISPPQGTPNPGRSPRQTPERATGSPGLRGHRDMHQCRSRPRIFQARSSLQPATGGPVVPNPPRRPPSQAAEAGCARLARTAKSQEPNPQARLRLRLDSGDAPAASSPGPSPPQPEEHRNGSSLSAAFDTTVTVTLTRQRDSDADGGGGSESVRPELRLSCGALVESASHTMRSQPGGRRPRLNFPRCQRDTWKLCSP